MPVTFGSIGDIIAVTLLIKDLVSALSDCHGSAHSFQQLLKQLQTLERVLLQVDLLVRRHELSPQLTALCVAAREAARACRESTEPFFARVKSYQTYLRREGSGNILKDVTHKVSWRVLKKEEVDKFYAEIAAHSNSLNMLLITWSITMIECHGSKTAQALDAADELERASNRTQEGLLNQILSRVDGAVNLSSNAYEILQKTQLASRMQWLQEMGSRLVVMMSRVRSTTFQTYSTVLSINTKMSWLYSQALLMDSPMVLVDSLGRRTPVHLQFVDSWDAFDAVIEVRFRNLHGHRKIIEKEYALQDQKSKLDIERHQPWNGAVVSGQQVSMEIIFRASELRAHKNGGCPGCFENCEAYVGEDVADEVQCHSCGLIYKRVAREMEPTAVVDHIVRVPPRASSSEKRRRQSSTIFMGTPEELDEPKHFKRIRLFSDTGQINVEALREKSSKLPLPAQTEQSSLKSLAGEPNIIRDICVLDNDDFEGCVHFYETSQTWQHVSCYKCACIKTCIDCDPDQLVDVEAAFHYQQALTLRHSPSNPPGLETNGLR